MKPSNSQADQKNFRGRPSKKQDDHQKLGISYSHKIPRGVERTPLPIRKSPSHESPKSVTIVDDASRPDGTPKRKNRRGKRKSQKQSEERQSEEKQSEGQQLLENMKTTQPTRPKELQDSNTSPMPTNEETPALEGSSNGNSMMRTKNTSNIVGSCESVESAQLRDI